MNFDEQPHTRAEVQRGRTYTGAEHPNIRFKSGKWEAYVREDWHKKYVGRFDSLDRALMAQRGTGGSSVRYIRQPATASRL